MAEGSDDFRHEFGDGDREPVRFEGDRLLLGDFHFSVDFEWIVSSDLRSEPVL